jgi:hypothetical protein
MRLDETKMAPAPVTGDWFDGSSSDGTVRAATDRGLRSGATGSAARFAGGPREVLSVRTAVSMRLWFPSGESVSLPAGDFCRSRGREMAAILFAGAVLLGAASLVFYEAAGQVYMGTSWATDVCSASKMFCGHPEYLAYAAGVALVLALGVKIGRALQ